MNLIDPISLLVDLLYLIGRLLDYLWILFLFGSFLFFLDEVLPTIRKEE